LYRGAVDVAIVEFVQKTRHNHSNAADALKLLMLPGLLTAADLSR
jgi:hypothetical protein